MSTTALNLTDSWRRIFWLAVFAMLAVLLASKPASAHAPNAQMASSVPSQSAQGDRSGDCDDTLSSPCTIPGAPDEDAVAADVDGAIARHELTINVYNTPGFKGLVRSSSGSPDCRGGCIISVVAGTALSLEALSDDSHTYFTGWDGDCTGTVPTCGPLIMTENRTVNAHFDVYAYPLTVTVSSEPGTGGSVTSSPNGIDCGITCTATFPYSSTVTLTATPRDSASAFTGWTGACADEESSVCKVQNTDHTTVSATFGKAKEKVRVDVSNTAGSKGRVSSNPPGIDCTQKACEGDFAYGVPLTLTATAENTRTLFIGWSGDCDGSDTGICVITPTTQVSVTAAFAPAATLKINLLGGGSGAVSSSYASGVASAEGAAVHDIPIPECTGEEEVCVLTVIQGKELTVLATPAEGSTFAGFTGACAGTVGNECVLPMNADTEIGVEFSLVTEERLTYLPAILR